MRIMFCKTGAVLRLGATADNASPVGDQRDALGVLEYLLDKGHDVCVFGCVHDEQNYAHYPNFHCIKPDVSNLDQDSLIKDVDEKYDEAAQKLIDWKPDICVNVGGMTPTTSYLGNPWMTSTQCFAIKYVGPALYALEKAKIPRLLIINDPRNYPREQEMTFWKYNRPAAVLSQETTGIDRAIKGTKFRIHTVYSKAENWWSYGMDEVRHKNLRKYDCLIVAHSHMADGRLKKGRDEVWQNILGDCNFDFTLFGKGWESFSRYDKTKMLGPCKPGEVHAFLRQTKMGPMIPCAHGFNTGKMRVYAINGALPLLYGRGCHLTYDVYQNYVPLTSGLRFETSDELRDLIKYWSNDEDGRRSVVEMLQEMTRPNFSKLDSCLHEFSLMQNWEQTTLKREWLADFGGYAYV